MCFCVCVFRTVDCVRGQCFLDVYSFCLCFLFLQSYCLCLFYSLSADVEKLLTWLQDCATVRDNALY